MPGDIEEETTEERSEREGLEYTEELEGDLEKVDVLFKKLYLNAISLIGNVQGIDTTKEMMPRVEMSNAETPALTQILDNSSQYLPLNLTQEMT